MTLFSFPETPIKKLRSPAVACHQKRKNLWQESYLITAHKTDPSEADLIYKYYLYPQLSGKQGLFHKLAKGQGTAPDVKHKRCCMEYS